MKLWFIFALLLYQALLIACLPSNAQETVSTVSAQEAFAVALAKAHARSYLFEVGASPFRIEAEGTTELALRARGKGSFSEDWVDSNHWQETLHFDDFTYTEMNNDEGRPWIGNAQKIFPFRASEFFDYVRLHLINTAQATTYHVSQSMQHLENGSSLNCFSAIQADPLDRRGEFRHAYKWCFDPATGLIQSIEIPLETRFVFTGYQSFGGKQVYTHVHATVSGIDMLDMSIHYSALDKHALDTLQPSSTMVRQQLVPQPNPGDLSSGILLHAIHPELPPDTPTALAMQPVGLRLLLAEDGSLLDATVETAPTEAMAKTAMQGAAKLQFSPFRNKGKPIQAHFFYTFHFVTSGISENRAVNPSMPLNLLQLRAMLKALGAEEIAQSRMPQEIERQQGQLPSYYSKKLITEALTQAATTDQAPILLPFYQQCYSQQDVRLLTHIFETPEGRVYGRHALGYVLDEQLQGKSYTDARQNAMHTQPGLTASVLQGLDEQDRHQAAEMFAANRNTELKACLGVALPKAFAAVQAAQTVTEKAVFEEHRSEIEAAKDKEDSQH